jgi:hypothetical protein
MAHHFCSTAAALHPTYLPACIHSLRNYLLVLLVLLRCIPTVPALSHHTYFQNSINYVSWKPPLRVVVFGVIQVV